MDVYGGSRNNVAAVGCVSRLAGAVTDSDAGGELSRALPERSWKMPPRSRRWGGSDAAGPVSRLAGTLTGRCRRVAENLEVWATALRGMVRGQGL